MKVKRYFNHWRWGRQILLAIAFLSVTSASANTLLHEDGGQEDGGLRAPKHEIVLEVRGQIANTNSDNSALFNMEMLRALPHRQLATTTAVTDGVRQFGGFLMRDLLALVGATGSKITATALNDYAIDIEADEFQRFDIIVAYEMDGKPLPASDKGPLWIIYPRDQHVELQDIRYDYRWVWQLHQVDVLGPDKP